MAGIPRIMLFPENDLFTTLPAAMMLPSPICTSSRTVTLLPIQQFLLILTPFLVTP
nr:hypothetical protein [Flavobacterium sp. 1]